MDGITTNPTHVAKSGKSFKEVIREIVAIVLPAQRFWPKWWLSILKGMMMRQARELLPIAPNVVIKIPLVAEGLKAIRALTDEGHKVNVTLCFSSVQALFAAKARRDLYLAVYRTAR